MEAEYIDVDSLQNTEDYRALMRALKLLRYQRIQALKDISQLCLHKEEFLARPIEFVVQLKNKTLVSLPQQQTIQKLPEVDFSKYLYMKRKAKRKNLLAPLREKPKKRIKKGASDKSLKAKDELAFTGSPKGEESGNGNDDEMEGPRPGDTRDSEEGETAAKKRKKGDRRNSISPSLWSTDEHKRLQKLLSDYPEEDTHRWSKISRALGTRTPKQCKRYFHKLSSEGRLRSPQQKKQKIKKERVDAEDLKSGFRTLSDAEDVDDDNFSDTEYCKKKQQGGPKQRGTKYRRKPYVHNGYKCDHCSVEPIVGVRWKCEDCEALGSEYVDLCEACVSVAQIQTKSHTPDHKMVEVVSPEPLYYSPEDYPEAGNDNETELDGLCPSLSPPF